MRIVFCGTPEFAVPSLQRLAEEPGFSIEGVITQPDRPRGRGQKVAAGPVKEAAIQLDLHVYQPESIKSESATDFLRETAPDVIVIIAYGHIIPARLLPLPRFGWINLHASLLPKYRGAAPIAWAIANGETTTGLTTMQIDAGMDTGPIVLQKEIPIGVDETAPELSARMAVAGAPLVLEALRMVEAGNCPAQAQDSARATFAPMLKKEDGRIDWNRTAGQINNRIRGFTPWPGAYTTLRGQTWQIWGREAPDAVAVSTEVTGEIVASSSAIYVMCGRGTILEIQGVQAEGRKRIAALDFANGIHLVQGERFGNP
ncbi:MAG: methionyl-tRNA formyltransferase [Candidatus Acidiferrales bacterium]